MNRDVFIQHMRDCVELQNEMNCVVSPDWQYKNWNLLLAAKQEASEAIDHFGWKWWKKQEPNIPQCKLELVDILHFLLSDMMVQCQYNTVDDVSVALDTTYNHYVFTRSLTFIDSMEGLIAVTQSEYLDDDTRFQDYYPFLYLFTACDCIDFEAEEMFKMYKAKNTLNNFRQHNGYKEGTYIKTWDGIEDNDYLLSIYENLHGNKADLINALQIKYLEVVNNSK